MSMRNLLRCRSEIYGFCAIWILLFHVFRWTGIGLSFVPLRNFISCGNCGVDVFLLLSGCSLFLSAERRYTEEKGFDYKRYYSRRFSRVIVPYLLLGTLLWLCKYLTKQSNGSLLRTVLHFVEDYTSVSFWRLGTQTTWFVFAICALYILFPSIYSIVRRQRKLEWLCLLSAAYILCICFQSAPIVRNSLIFWARIPVFIWGVMAGAVMDRLDLSAWKPGIRRLTILAAWLVCVVSFCVFSITESLNAKNLSLLVWLLYFPLAVSLLICMESLHSCKVYAEKLKPFSMRIGQFFAWYGGFSLELYLAHLLILYVFRHYQVFSAVGAWTYLLVLLLSTPLAYVGQRLSDSLADSLKKGETLSSNETLHDIRRF